MPARSEVSSKAEYNPRGGRSKTKRRGRRRSKRLRTNPWPDWAVTTAWVGGGILALGAAAYGLKELRERVLAGPSYKGLPPPPQQAPQPPGTPACGRPEYPGFVVKNGQCVPGPTTPPGIYVLPDCLDFVFVEGDTGPQHERLASIVETAIADSSDPESPSIDPAILVANFLAETWPTCPWPPAGDGPPRIVHMFMALSLVVGHTIVNEGGRVLGTAVPDVVDEQIASRFAELGLPDFDPSIVPEIVIPEIVLGPFLAKPVIGPFVAHPYEPFVPPPVGPGGLLGPEQGEQKPKPLKKCQTTPYAPLAFRNKDLPSAEWNEIRQHEIKIFDFGIDDFADCKEWSLRFGFCMWPTSGQLYGLLNPDYEEPSVPVLIRNEDNSPIHWGEFTWHPLYKRQYQLKVALVDGVAKLVPGTTQNYDGGVDPCQEKQKIWPTPTSGRYLVTAKGGGALPGFSETLWHPGPFVTWKSKGKKFYAVLQYSGMPVFHVGCVSGGGVDPSIRCDPFGAGLDVGNYPDAATARQYVGKGVAQAGQKTPFRMDYKVWGIGGWK